MHSSPYLTKAVVGSSARIFCGLGDQREAPIWNINETAYDLLSIPQHFPSIPIITEFSSLIIWEVTREWNNTLFECLSIKENGIVPGLKSTLIVYGGMLFAMCSYAFHRKRGGN